MALFGPTSEKVEKWVATGKINKLIGALQSSDAVIRRLAAEGLGKIGGPQVLDFCKENASSMDENVRWHITQILGLIGTPEAMKILETVQNPAEKIGMGAAKKQKQQLK